MSTFRALRDASLDGKRVLLRAGFDVPLDRGSVADTSRIEAVVPTVKLLLEKGASVVILSHQDRPKGKVVPEMSQKPLVPVLSQLLGTEVFFAESCTGAETKTKVDALTPGGVLLLENLRFDPREESNDEGFAAELASYGDAYVNDAFTNCHRSHASMDALARRLPAYMGLQLEQEVTNLSRVTENPARPLTLIVSGAKIETKLPVIERFLRTGDNVLVGGAIANTFIAAAGHGTGSSLTETEFIPVAADLLKRAGRDGNATLHIPLDVVTAPSPEESAAAQTVSIDGIAAGRAALDLGSATAERYAEIIRESQTIVWNGPLGVFRVSAFAEASRRIASELQAAAARGATVIVGGGDTLDFLAQEGIEYSSFTFVSTGGGAMLDFVSGRPLPALTALGAGA